MQTLAQDFTRIISTCRITVTAEVQRVSWNLTREAGLDDMEVVRVMDAAVKEGWLMERVEPPYSDQRHFLTATGREVVARTNEAQRLSGVE